MRSARVGNRLDSLSFYLSLLFLVTIPSGCCHLRPYRTPPGIEKWQDTSQPQLSLREKAEAYQSRVESWHQMPDGMIRYRFKRFGEAVAGGRGNHADGSFFMGIYLASQALRYAVTQDPAAKEQILFSLRGMKLYAEISGKRGLLARYFSPVAPGNDERWRPSPTHPRYFWRSDVSKDQYAGFVHGLGVTLAVVSEPEIRSEISRLAAAVADHLIDNDLQLIDWDGQRTTYGNLRGRILGVPIGVNALIALAIAKTAAESNPETRYAEFYARLLADGYPGITYWAHFSMLGRTKRVNDNMGYLALYPLLLLERNQEITRELRQGARRTWRYVRNDRNAFFAFVQAAVVGNSGNELQPGQSPSDEGREKGRESLAEFPDRKIGWPVDLTREGFDFQRSCFRRSDCTPRTTRAVPLSLRPRGSSLWVSDPYRLVGRLRDRGETEFSGIDYLIAYWIGRYHGFVGADE